MTISFRTQGGHRIERAGPARRDKRRGEADRAANAGERARRSAAERVHVNRSLMVSGGGPPKRPRAQYLVATGASLQPRAGRRSP